MKRLILLVLFVFFAAGPAMAQEATGTAEPPNDIIELPVRYVEVMPAWVLPGFALAFTLIAFLVYIIYRQGTHLKDMIDEKTFAGLLRIVRDVAKDLAARTENKIDDALANLIPGGETPAPAAPTTNVVVNVPAVDNG